MSWFKNPHKFKCKCQKKVIVYKTEKFNVGKALIKILLSNKKVVFVETVGHVYQYINHERLEAQPVGVQDAKINAEIYLTSGGGPYSTSITSSTTFKCVKTEVWYFNVVPVEAKIDSISDFEVEHSVGYIQEVNCCCKSQENQW